MEDTSSPQVGEIKSAVKPSVSKKISSLIGIELVIIIILGIVISLILNYFSILPLSKKFPAVFGFLPHKARLNENNNVPPAQNTALGEMGQPQTSEVKEKVLFTCPFVEGVCSTGKTLYDTGIGGFRGIGYVDLNEGVDVLALLEGDLEIKEEGEWVSLELKSKNTYFIVTYIFLGAPQKRNGQVPPVVAQGEIIGKLSGKTNNLVSFTTQKYNLYVEVKDTRTGEIVALTPSSEGRSLIFK